MKHHIIQTLASLIAASLATTALAAPVTDDFSSYPVGQIPYTADVTPTGARTYTVPIATTPFGSFLPSLSLQYSSQSGTGIAGHGWTVGGLSAITMINANSYYHGHVSAASLEDTSPLFALDGVPIVKSSIEELSGDYPYETARGHILVCPHVVNGKTVWFDVLYPNGSKAVYGFPSNAQNSSNRISYPLTKMRDINGTVIDFFYDCQEPTGIYYPSTIFYNYDKYGVPTGRIYFDYESVDSGTISYYAGQKIQCRKLLKAVRSNSGDDNLYTYTLTHESRFGANLLASIGCRMGETGLRPLRFHYQEQPADSPDFYVAHTRNVSILPAGDLRYLRGRFLSGATSDGVIILPDKSNYVQIASMAASSAFKKSYFYKYGSGYNATDKIVVIPDVSSSTTEIIMDVEAGFQAIETLDVDDDGVDEIVKVNFVGTDGDYTKLRITIYDYNAGARRFDSRSFDIKTYGVIRDKSEDDDYWVSPYQRTYLFGKFDGVGAHMVAVSLNRDFRGVQRTSRTAIVDLNTGKCTDRSHIDLVALSQMFACDLDNDGKTELCYIEPNGGITLYRYSVYHRVSTTAAYSSGLVTMDPYKTVQGLNYGSLIGKPYYCADWNGDGYLDIVVPPGETYLDPNYSGGNTGTGSPGSVGGIIDGGSEWSIYSYTGEKFERTVLNLGQRRPGDGYMFMDVNRDGLSDMLCFRGKKLRCHLNDNGNFYSESAIFSTASMPSSKGVIYNNILGYNAISGLMTIDGHTITSYKFSDNRGANRLVAEMEDSYGVLQTNEYANLMDSDAVYGNDGNRSYSSADGFARVAFPLALLHKTTTYGNPDKTGHRVADAEYTYYDAVSGSGGLGFCGFGKVRCEDKVAEVVSVQENAPEKLGVPLRSSKALLSSPDTPFETIVNTYDANSTEYGKMNPRLIMSEHADSLTNVMTTTKLAYGDYDLPVKKVIVKRIGTGTTKGERTTYSYSNSLTKEKYVLGLTDAELTAKYTIGSRINPHVIARTLGNISWKTEYEYDDRCRLVYKKSRRGSVGKFTTASPTGTASGASVFVNDEFDQTKTVSETCYEYDDFGNVLSERTANFGASEYVGVSRTYTSDGHFLTSETDALGLVTRYADYNRFGKPEHIVNHHGDTTRISYDALGNVLRIETPDGAITTRTLAWGGQGILTVTESSNVAPTTVTHYDGIGRKVHTENLRFDGQWQKTDYAYDSKGQLSRETMPYRGPGPAAWIYYSYDNYGRSTIVSTPDKTTRRIYSGNTVTEWRNGISKTVKYDALGNVWQVDDPGGSITYIRRDDAQPSSVVAGGVTTTFGYDRYGRRIRIDDPSAGVQTDTTAWNADGTSVRTQTNPNGQIVSYFDKFGRLTKTDRLGEYSTSYSYDSYGRLASEVSTNGTSKTYTYDRYDRVLTEKETVPDGKWLLKNYAYGAGSRVNSIRYTAQSGDIATENYLYSNGHGIGIVLSEGTVVMRLEEENDLGMPLRVTTGEVTREYGYSSSGMPVSRKIDGVMDFEYSFRLLSGNLDSRKDNTRNLSESFNYDALNRLVKMDDRTVCYSSSGNVTSVGGIGEMAYGNSDRPYQVTSLTPEDDSLVPSREQTVSYTCYGRPSRLVEGGKSASFTYNGSGDRVKMLYAEGVSPELTRYYIGGRYEQDIRSGGASTERLYLGGDAYSAPMVLVREGSGSWTPLNIGRDYLGSITHIVTADGTLLAEYSYDPWGRLRDPETQEIYAPGTEPTLYLGRGFTGHEHLPWFGLINMNARLYDPLLCRFLSPDPYVQAPDFTQSFNRYSYGLNNPLSYTDPSGEYWHLIIGAAVGGIVNWLANGCEFTWKGLGYFAVGAFAGAVSAGIGAGVSSSLAGTGFSAGLWGTSNAATALSCFSTGFKIGAASGAAGGFINGLGNSLISGENFGKSLGIAALGAIGGGLAGGLCTGLAGGISAVKDGRNFLHGGRIVRSVSIDLPQMNQVGELDCRYETFRSIDTYYNGSTDDVAVLRQNYPNAELCDKTLGDMYRNNGMSASYELKRNESLLPMDKVLEYADLIADRMQNNHVMIYEMRLWKGMGHSTAISKIVIYDNFRIKMWLMNPSGVGGRIKYNFNNLYNLINIFKL